MTPGINHCGQCQILEDGRDPIDVAGPGFDGDHHEKAFVKSLVVRSFAVYQAYCASPLPKDQFSLATSTRLTNTSSRRTPGAAASLSATRL